jgi:uncharacterized iron-regulated membrane protein
MRQFLLVSHRWIALVAAVFVFIVAATGSILVFEGAIDRALHPELWHVRPGAAPMSLDTIAAHARAAMPKAPVTGITLSPAADRADVVQAGGTQVFVDPYTGAVLGMRTIAQWNQTFPRRVHVLHVSLMAGKAGAEIVGVATIVSLVLVLTGLILWWPDKIWSVQWSASWKRVVFDLHHALGVLAAVVLVVITASGLAIHYRTLNALMYGLDRTPAPGVPSQPAAPAGARAISIDSLDRVATGALPGARVMFLTLPPKRDQPFVAAMRFPEDHTPGGRSRVFVDRHTGATLLAVSTRRAQMGTRLGNAIRSIHTGDLFGKPTEAIWLLAALVLSSQGVTGVLMWWNGRAARVVLRRDAGAVRDAGLGGPSIAQPGARPRSLLH